jgi:NADPH2:quinone reductase
LARLGDLGADTTIQLDQAPEALKEAYLSEMGEAGFQGFDVILDYLWGEPTEALLAALTKSEFAVAGKDTRLVQVGESAGATIKLPAAVLRSTAVTILGTAGIAPREVLLNAMQHVLERGATGDLRIETERVAMAEVESVWRRAAGRRIVLVP